MSSVDGRSSSVQRPARTAGVAQLAEHLPCKQGVRGSSPLASSAPSSYQVVRSRGGSEKSVATQTQCLAQTAGGLPEWPKGADCKSAGYAFDGSNPSPSTLANRSPTFTRTLTRHHDRPAGVAQLVERQPSKLNVAGSNPVSRSRSPRPPSSVVEHFLGKEEVTGSSPVVGSKHQRQ